MDELKKDIKDIKDTLHGQSKELTKYNILLEEHIRRTNIIEDELEPIKNHVNFVHTLGKLVIAAVTVAASISSILAMFGK